MQFTFNDTPIPGVKLITLNAITDARGWFLKTFHAPTFAAQGLETNFPEAFVSLSKRHVIRGMHFQTPPHDHAKLVRCVTGKVRDVVLDLRTQSATYGQCASFILDAATPQVVYIPTGMAHGFITLSEEAVLEYHTSTVHQPASDSGIRWDSFGFDWGLGGLIPTLSARDNAFANFSEFVSPFLAPA